MKMFSSKGELMASYAQVADDDSLDNYRAEK